MNQGAVAHVALAAATAHGAADKWSFPAAHLPHYVFGNVTIDYTCVASRGRDCH
jgi:hypothetical protein